MKTILLTHVKKHFLPCMLLLAASIKASISSSFSDSDIQSPSINDAGAVELVANRQSVSIPTGDHHTDISDTKNNVTTHQTHNNNTPNQTTPPSENIWYILNKWVHKFCESITFWRVYEYQQISYHPGYEAGIVQGGKYCLWDTWDLIKTRCKRINSIPKVAIYKNARAYGHPICTRTVLFSATIILYALVNIVIKDENILDKLIGDDFQICKNDLLDNAVRNLTPYESSLLSLSNTTETLNNLLGFYNYLLNDIVVDFSQFTGIPNTTALDQLEEELTLYSLEVNATHYRGYTAYPDFWPEKATETKVQNFYVTNNITSASNTTTVIQSSTTSDITTSESNRQQTLCFTIRFSDIKTIEYGLDTKGENCKTFTFPAGIIILNKTTTIDNITNFQNIENNFFTTTVTSDISFIELTGIDPGATIDPNVTTEEFTNLAQSVYQARKQQVKKAIETLFGRIKTASSSYPFVAAASPILTTGYVVNKLGLKLRCLTSMESLSRIPFIIIVVSFIYLFQFIPNFQLKDIFIVFRNPQILLNFILDLGTGICHLQSREELTFLFGLGQVAAQQQKLVNQMRNLVEFVNNDRAIEATYQNITDLPYQDLYQNLTAQNSIYEQELTGAIFRDGFSVLSGKVLCDLSKLNSNTTIPLHANCATLADNGYLVSILNQMRENYILSFVGISWAILLYPFMPAAVTAFIEAIFGSLCPMARYRGRFISTEGMQEIENQRGVMRFIRRTNILPFAISAPIVLIGLINGIVF